MKMSKLFSQTLRESVASAEISSHDLLLRAGFIRPLASGIFSYLPLAIKSIRKIENIIREEINAIDGQEICMPVSNPADVWKESKRWYQIDSEMARFKDRNDRDMVLAMTHEEIAADLVRKEIHSYRQLPALIYHIQTKFRDDARPRAGLIRVREFTMKDSYSLDSTWEGLDKQYQAHYDKYFTIYHRCGLPVIAVGSDMGMMGGKMAHEFMYLNEVGEDTLVLCDKCGFSANRQIAEFKKTLFDAVEPELALEEILTPHTPTIKDLTDFLKIDAAHTIKAIMLMATYVDPDHIEERKTIDKFVLGLVRGDYDLNETKLTNALGARSLRAADESEIIEAGLVPGFASSVGVSGIQVVVDNSIQEGINYVAGANKKDYHLKNVRLGRDIKADFYLDIAAASDKDCCNECGAPLNTVRGVEVGNIFKLGTKYSELLGCMFQDKDGKEKPVIMGSYGIGVGRLLACAVEEHHDEKGIIWPISIAPYQVYLVNLSKTDKAEEIYKDLQAAGVEVIFDDRDERAGVKFNDAELIGIPLRITVGDRSLKNGKVEMKRRDGGDNMDVELDTLVETVKKEIQTLWDELAQNYKL